MAIIRSLPFGEEWNNRERRICLKDMTVSFLNFLSALSGCLKKQSVSSRVSAARFVSMPRPSHGFLIWSAFLSAMTGFTSRTIVSSSE
jgi:hypothetical protein